MNSNLMWLLLPVACLGAQLLAIGMHDHFRVKKIIREQKAADARKAARTPKEIEDDACMACIALCGFAPDLLDTSKEAAC